MTNCRHSSLTAKGMLQILLRELMPEASKYIHGRTGTTESSGGSRIFQTWGEGSNPKGGH